MKKLILTLVLLGSACVATAHEGFRHYGYRGPCCYNGGWVAPAIIGGVIGYELSRPRPVYVEPQPVYVQPQPVYVQTPITQAPAGYHWQEMIDPATNEKKIVLVPN